MAGLEFSGTRWLVVLIVGLTSVVMVMLGYGILALVLVTGLSTVAVARRPERLARVEQFLDAAELPHSCDVVWALIYPAELSPTIQPLVRRGYHVPGTPAGLGEHQAFELVDGTTIVAEVVEFGPARRAVMRQVLPPPFVQIRFVHSLEPIEGGCVYTSGYEIDVPAGQRVEGQMEEAMRSSIREQIERIRHSLAATDPGTATQER